jgi:hypothetical protein
VSRDIGTRASGQPRRYPGFAVIHRAMPSGLMDVLLRVGTDRPYWGGSDAAQIHRMRVSPVSAWGRGAASRGRAGRDAASLTSPTNHSPPSGSRPCLRGPVAPQTASRLRSRSIAILRSCERIGSRNLPLRRSTGPTPIQTLDCTERGSHRSSVYAQRRRDRRGNCEYSRAGGLSTVVVRPPSWEEACSLGGIWFVAGPCAF